MVQLFWDFAAFYDSIATETVLEEVIKQQFPGEAATLAIMMHMGPMILAVWESPYRTSSGHSKVNSGRVHKLNILSPMLAKGPSQRTTSKRSKASRSRKERRKGKQGRAKPSEEEQV